MSDRYDDIIDLPHHVSAARPHMKPEERAAQFAPFSALTGYGDAIEETVRLTDAKTEMGEDALAILNRKLLYLSEHIQERPAVSVLYFEPDRKKTGGAYRTASGILKDIDICAQTIVLICDGKKLKKLPIADVAELELLSAREASGEPPAF